MEKPRLDESRASEFIGRRILIGVAYVDETDTVIERRQWSGRILTYSNSEGIRVQLDGSDEYCCLLPDPDALRKARPGVYRLKSSGKEIVDPDYTTIWTCHPPDEGDPQGP